MKKVLLSFISAILLTVFSFAQTVVNEEKALIKNSSSGLKLQTVIPSQNTAISVGCNNTDFEQTDLTNWSGFYGWHPNAGPYTGNYGGPAANAGVIPGRHTVTMDGVDQVAYFATSTSDGFYSLKLGNNDINSEAERVEQTFTVSSNTPYIKVLFAPILNGGNHKPGDQPYFETKMLDKNGNIIPCSHYKAVYGSMPSTSVHHIASYESPYQNTGSPVDYIPWNALYVDLTAYIGQNVTLQFTTADCAQGGHFGYAYVDANCNTYNEQVKASYCPRDRSLVMYGPTYYDWYEWFAPDGTPLTQYSNSDDLKRSFQYVANPVDADIYKVIVHQINGCTLTLYYQLSIPPIPPESDVSTYEIDQNVFTPNGDGLNDVVKTSQFGDLEQFKIQVFNRWGRKIFESTDPLVEWNGKIQSDPNGVISDSGIADEGTYYYMVSFIKEDCGKNSKKEHSNKGFIQLLR